MSARRRATADEIAAEAASRIRGETHAALLALDDEQSNAYGEIERILREVRDANPPTRFLTTHAQVDKRFVIGVDPEEDESEKSHLGDEIFADDELPQVLAGERPEVNAVFADEFGVWITGLAPIRDASGRIVAAVAADLPALSASESETLRGDGRQTFAAMLQTAAVRLSRAEIDAITDALTGLYNHRYLHERLSEELHRARDLQRPLSVLFCDLDHFKGYNDSNGHSAGDAVLREVAHVIEQSVRNIDVAGRYGGEEFVVLLVETEREAALVVAERIRERIRAAGFTAERRAADGEHRRRRLPGRRRPPRGPAQQGGLGDVPRQAPRPRPGGELRRRVTGRGAKRRRASRPRVRNGGGGRRGRRRAAGSGPPGRSTRGGPARCGVRTPRRRGSRPASLRPRSPAARAARRGLRPPPARPNHRSLSTRTTSPRRASTSRIWPSSRDGRRSSSASVASVGGAIGSAPRRSRMAAASAACSSPRTPAPAGA